MVLQLDVLCSDIKAAFPPTTHKILSYRSSNSPNSMDLRAICSRYAACMSERKFTQLPEFVHDGVIYNAQPPMTSEDYGRMIDGIVCQFDNFSLVLEMLVVDDGCSTDLDGMVSARFRLSYDSQSEKLVKDRVVFYEHVFFQFKEGKIIEIWPLVAWPEK
ncbi:hypothetical protein CLAIMM_03442 [Cladophialophora immunda]|nr:hypothetical protein CLAIMM_03442 [Cladophialophora immunda]